MGWDCFGVFVLKLEQDASCRHPHFTERRAGWHPQLRRGCGAPQSVLSDLWKIRSGSPSEIFILLAVLLTLDNSCQ
jgi:hypothetical protein